MTDVEITPIANVARIFSPAHISPLVQSQVFVGRHWAGFYIPDKCNRL